MRRIALFVLVLGLAASLAAAATGRQARVAVTDRSPLTVRGSGFKAFERVVVTISSGTRVTARRTATASGAFVVRLQVAPGGKLGCDALVVRATGSLGTRVSTKVPGIECPPGPAEPGQ
jgi:hypothetical protein